MTDTLQPPQGVCAQCHRDPPDGREQQRQLDGDESLWLHAACEDAYLQRRLSEEGLTTHASNGGMSDTPPPQPPQNGTAVVVPAPQSNTPQLRFTTYVSRRRLAKHYKRKPDGDLETMSGTQFSSGGYYVCEIPAAGVTGPSILAVVGQVIDKLTSKQAIGLGVPLNGTIDGHHRHQGSARQGQHHRHSALAGVFRLARSRPAVARRRRHRRTARNPERALSAVCRGRCPDAAVRLGRVINPKTGRAQGRRALLRRHRRPVALGRLPRRR